MRTVERVEGDDGSGRSGSGLDGHVEKVEHSLDGLESLVSGFPEDGKIASFTSEAEQGGECEVVLH